MSREVVPAVASEVIDPEAFCLVCGDFLYMCPQSRRDWPWLADYRPDWDC